MCLIVFAWQAHARYSLVVAANRDEFHARPTASAARWAEAPQLAAGRDLEAGGTWLGIADGQRFAAVTNVREPGIPPGKRSRGALSADYLRGNLSPTRYLEQLDPREFSGFNLLLGDAETLIHASNRGVERQVLKPGVYGLSNRSLDTPWPKLIKARRALEQALPGLPNEDSLFALLGDRQEAPDADLPATGVSREWERRLSAIFIQSPDYGTRASTLVLRDTQGQTLIERSFSAEGERHQSVRISTSV